MTQTSGMWVDLPRPERNVGLANLCEKLQLHFITSILQILSSMFLVNGLVSIIQ